MSSCFENIENIGPWLTNDSVPKGNNLCFLWCDFDIVASDRCSGFPFSISCTLSVLSL